MTQQAVQAQRRPETQRRVDLRLPRLPHELHREQQRQRRREPGLAIPQAAAEVVDQRDAAEPGEERRQQERDAQRARRLQAQPRSARRTAAACPRTAAPPTRGSSHSPVATMSRATSAKRGSSAGQGSRRPMPVAISSSASASSHRTSDKTVLDVRPGKPIAIDRADSGPSNI